MRKMIKVKIKMIIKMMMNRNKEYPLSCVLVGTFCDDKENIEVKEEDIKIIVEK